MGDKIGLLFEKYGPSGEIMKHRSAVKTAIRIWSLAAIPAGLIVSMLFPRFVASVFGMAQAIMADTICVQTVCPLIPNRFDRP